MFEKWISEIVLKYQNKMNNFDSKSQYSVL